jgi:sigma-B regulation protein RsbU (phosphoserine phosphatase)
MSKKRIKLGIKVKAAAVFIAMGLLLSVSVGYAVYSISYREVTAHHADLAFDAAKVAVTLINGDSIADYLKNGKNAEYDTTYTSLQKLKEIFGLTYLYVVSCETDADGFVYVFDIFTEGNDAALIEELGEKYDEDEGFETARETYLTGQVADSAIVTNTKYGWLASAFMPIYASDGSIVAVVGADISMDRILRAILIQTEQITLMVASIIVLFLCVLLLVTERQILRPIVWLSQHMDGFASEDGTLEEFEIFHTGDELQAMGESFNRMINDLHLYMENLATVTADRERIATELDVATKIQASMLPCIFPAFPHRTEFDIYASMQPAKEVGGDFYDFFFIDNNTLAIVIADVSGKGIPAALFMVIAKTLIKNNAQEGKSPKEVFESVNNLLCENNAAGMFVTAFLGYFDVPSGRFTYVNAGHNPPLIKANGQFEWLKVKPGLMLAFLEEATYTQHEVTLKSGDELFMYTDGVTEAANLNNDLFGEPLLLEIVNRYKGVSAEEFIQSIRKEVDLFAGGAEQVDDITMLALEMRGH